MSKKRTISPNVNATITNKWEPNIVTAELNETNWSYSLAFLVENIPEDNETIIFINKGISTGLRKRFTLITKEKIHQLIAELGNPKSKKGKEVPNNFEICEAGKVYLDKGEILPVTLLARLIKWIILTNKTEDLKKINEKNKKSDGKATKAKQATDKNERLKSSGSKKGSQGKKSPEPPSVKQDTKLRKRGDPDPDIQYIDDEPDDGSNRYFIVTGMVDCKLLEALVEIGCVATSIIKITRDIHIPKYITDDVEDIPDKMSGTSAKESEIIESKYEEDCNCLKLFWSNINGVLNQNIQLQNTPIITLIAKHLMFPIDGDNEETKNKCSMELFETLAVLKYDLLDLKRQWQNYLGKSKLIPLAVKGVPPIADESTPRDSFRENLSASKESNTNTFDKLDTDYYNYLMQDLPIECTSVYLQMSAMLDQDDIRQVILIRLRNYNIKYIFGEKITNIEVEVTCGEKATTWNQDKSEFSSESNENTLEILKTLTENIYLPKEDLIDLQNSLKITKNDVDQSKVQESNAPIHSLDSISLRDLEIESKVFEFKSPMMHELQMLISSFRHLDLMKVISVEDDVRLKRASRTQELLKYLENAGLSTMEINFAIKLFLLENLTLSGVDENGFIRTNNEDGIFQRNLQPVWDDPYMIVDEMHESILNDELALSKKKLMNDELENMMLKSEFTSSSLKSDHYPDGILKSSRLSSRSQSPEFAKMARRKSSVHFLDTDIKEPVTELGQPQSDILNMLSNQNQDSLQSILLDYLTNVRKRNFSEWCFEEFYEPHVLLQIIHEALYKLPYVDIYHQRQVDDQLVVLHNPFHPDSKLNQQPWDLWLHSNVGFRNYLDHVNEKITDWTRDQEAIYQANLLNKELQSVEAEPSEVDAKEKTMKTNDKAKKPAASKARSRSSSRTSSNEENNNKEFTLILPGSLKALKLEQDKHAKEKEEEELKKQQKQKLLADKKTEKDVSKEVEKSGDSKKSSSKNKKTAFDDSTDLSEKDNTSELGQIKVQEEEEEYFPFISYDLKDNLAHFSGNVVHLFPSDGTTIRIFKMQKLLDSTSVRVSAITTQSHVFTIHIIDPKFVQDPEIDNFQKVLDHFQKPNCLSYYGASTCTFKDGLTIVSSNNGYSGTLVADANVNPTSESKDIEESSKDVGDETNKTDWKTTSDSSNFPIQMDMVGLPNIIFSTPHGVTVKIGYKATDKNEFGRNLLLFMSSNKVNRTSKMTQETSNLAAAATEVGRYVTADGRVVLIYSNDMIKVLFPDGTICSSQLTLETSNIEEDKDKSKVEKTNIKESPTQKRKSKHSKSVDQQVLSNSNEVNEPKQTFNYFRKWTITLPNGEIFETEADLNSLFLSRKLSNRNEMTSEYDNINENNELVEIMKATEKINYFPSHQMKEPLLVSSATDPSSGETLVTRSDGTWLLVSQNAGIFLVEYLDGTRFTKYYVMEKVQNANSGNGEISKSKVTEKLLIESKEYPSITIDLTNGTMKTDIGSMGTLFSNSTGHHVYKHSDNTEIEYRPDGEIIFLGSHNSQMAYLQPGGPCSYVFNTTSNIICEIVDSEGSEFVVDVNGDYSVKIQNKSEIALGESRNDGELEYEQPKDEHPISAMSFTGNGNIRKYDQHAPRIFAVNFDGSGSELLRYRDIVETFSNAEIDENSFHCQEELQESQQIIAHTILHAHCENKPWKYDYCRKTILPKGLTCRDLKSFPASEEDLFNKRDGKFAMNVGCGLSINTNPTVTDSRKMSSKKLRHDLWSNPVEFRQFYHYPMMGNELRNSFSNELIAYNMKILRQRQQYRDMYVVDERSDDEKILADEIRRKFKAIKYSGGQMVNNAIQFLLQNSQDGSDEKNAQKTGIVESNPIEKPNLNQRKLDIILEQEKIQKEKEMEIKLALKNKIVPNYFSSAFGKEFISTQAVDLQSLNKSMKLFTMKRDETGIDELDLEKDEGSNEAMKIDSSSIVSPPSLQQSQVLPSQTIGSVSGDFDKNLNIKKKGKKFLYYDSSLIIPTGPKQTPKSSNICLPNYLFSQRPVVEPNIRQSTIEDPVRRKVYTTSLIGGTNTSQMFLRQTRGINVLPARIDTGLIQEGRSYTFKIKLINTGPECSYFKIKQPPQSTGLWVEFLPGPIAAGLSRTLTIHLNAMINNEKDNNSDISIFEHSLHITTNTDKLVIPIVGRVMPADKYDSIYPTSDPNPKSSSSAST